MFEVLVPYRQIELYSPLPVAVLLSLLEKSVEPKRWARFGGAARPFEGTVGQSTFDIRRIIAGRNSFSPQMIGSVTTEGQGSRVLLTMRLLPVVAIFTSIWCGALVCFAVAAAVSSNGTTLVPLLAPVGMALFGAVLAVGSFAFEARKAERLLAALLQAERRAASD
ncbi:MAG: hypothetical protein QM756_19650 [Polyangiaceae bacterium]